MRFTSKPTARATVSRCFLFGQARPALCEASQDSQQVLDIDRLDEMLVEARWVGARHAGGLRVTADSDQPDLLQLRIGSEQSQEVKTIHVGQSDIQKRDTGLEFARDGQGIFSAVGNLH